VKVRRLEDELNFKQHDLARKAEAHEQAVKRDLLEIEQRKQELLT